MGENNPRKDRAIAAALTFLCVLALLLLLFFGGLSWERQELAIASTPEIMETEPEFYEPELLNLGEENALTQNAPAEAAQGDPLPSPDEQIKQPAPSQKTSTEPKEPLNTQKRPNEAKADTAGRASDREQAAQALAGKFGPKNGNEGTSATGTGAGGSGTGVTGSAKGRTFISCPKPSVTLRHKTVVTVSVTIDADGNVTKASARGGADAEIRKKCEEAAKKAKWSAKKGVAATSGSITFTIYPK